MSPTAPDFAPPGMIDLNTAADRFQINKQAINRWAAARIIPSQKVNRRIFIRPEDLIAALKASGRSVPEVAV
jgi:hypothetical protein